MNLDVEKAEYRPDPYPHVVVDDAFGESDALEADFPGEDDFPRKAIRMDADMSFPDAEYLRLLCRSKTYLSLHDYVYSPAFTNDLLRLLEAPIRELRESGELLVDPLDLPRICQPLETKIFERFREPSSTPFLFPRLDLGYGGLDYGRRNGGGGIHTDNWNRLVSVVYYVNSNESMVGGEHRMYRLEDGVPVLAREYAPRKGRMIASLQTNKALHDVNPITRIRGRRNAYYLAVSCSTRLWREDPDWLMELTRNRSAVPSTASRSWTEGAKRRLGAWRRALRAQR